MNIIWTILIAAVLVQTSLCTSGGIECQQRDISLSRTTTKLLSSFQNCIVYILENMQKNDTISLTSTKYFRHYSEFINCAVVVDTPWLYGNESALNPRFVSKEPPPLFTKYTTTLINLYSPGTTTRILKEEWSAAAGFYNAIAFYNILFSYILVFMSNEEFSSVDNVGLASMFVDISAPAAYLLILDELEVNVIGFSLAMRSAPYVFRIAELQEPYNQQLHKAINKDLQGGTAIVWNSLYWKPCTFGRPVEQHVHFCILDVAAEYFNVTFLNEIEYPYTRPSITEIYPKQIMNSRTFSGYIIGEDTKFVFDNYAIHLEQFSFLCIAQLKTVGLMAFLQAYDLLTWIVTVTACLCLSATIAAMAINAKVSFWTKLQSSVPVVLMLLIERFYGYGQVIRSASKPIVLVITLWAFGAMLLGMCYSGNMITLLTSPSLPHCPDDLQQLSEIVEYPILTDTEIPRDGVLKPFFHGQIDDYLENYAHANGSLVHILQKFGKSMNYVSNIARLVPSNHNTSSKIMLAYVGHLNEVSTYGMWSVTQSSKIHVLRGANLPFFMSLSPFLVKNNFLAPKFLSFLANLSKCGLWKYWTDCLSAYLLNFHFQRFKVETTKKLAFWKEQQRQRDLATIWRNFDPLVYGETSWSALTLDTLNAAFAFIVTFLMLALCVFLKERYTMQDILHLLLRMAHNVSIMMNQIRLNFPTFLRMVGKVPKLAIKPKPTQTEYVFFR